MYPLAHDPTVASHELWTWMLVSAEIGAALSALEHAGSALAPLADDTDWQSEGLRALHVLLRRLRDDAGAEIGELRVRQWELDAGAGE